MEGAKILYQRSVDIKRNASSLFNLGVTHYHLSSYSFRIRWSLFETQPHEKRSLMKLSILGKLPLSSNHLAQMHIPVRLRFTSLLRTIFAHTSPFVFRPSERVLESSSITARSRPPTPPASVLFPSPATTIYLITGSCFRVAAKLAPEDSEIAFNLASVLEACWCFLLLGFAYDSHVRQSGVFQRLWSITSAASGMVLTELPSILKM